MHRHSLIQKHKYTSTQHNAKRRWKKYNLISGFVSVLFCLELPLFRFQIPIHWKLFHFSIFTTLFTPHKNTFSLSTLCPNLLSCLFLSSSLPVYPVSSDAFYVHLYHSCSLRGQSYLFDSIFLWVDQLKKSAIAQICTDQQKERKRTAQIFNFPKWIQFKRITDFVSMAVLFLSIQSIVNSLYFVKWFSKWNGSYKRIVVWRGRKENFGWKSCRKNSAINNKWQHSSDKTCKYEN